jgi:hypothetical protein
MSPPSPHAASRVVVRECAHLRSGRQSSATDADSAYAGIAREVRASLERSPRWPCRKRASGWSVVSTRRRCVTLKVDVAQPGPAAVRADWEIAARRRAAGRCERTTCLLFRESPCPARRAGDRLGGNCTFSDIADDGVCAGDSVEGFTLDSAARIRHRMPTVDGSKPCFDTRGYPSAARASLRRPLTFRPQRVNCDWELGATLHAVGLHIEQEGGRGAIAKRCTHEGTPVATGRARAVR